MVNGKREYKRGQALPWEVLFILYEKLQPVCMEIEFPKENQKEKPKKKQEMRPLVWTFTNNRDIINLHVKTRFTM